MSTSQLPTRTEKDSLGELQVPADAYYGVQTQRAILNFPISGTPLPRPFIHAHVMLKKAAALVNTDLNLLDKKLSDAIVQAADEVLADTPWSLNQFPVDVYQTGSGTSTNMNVNEVLASRANELLGGKRGDKSPVHPNDHVNMSQSSNDTIPTSMRVMAHTLINGPLFSAAGLLTDSLHKKAQEFWHIIKTGRTHLQDATPIRLGQEFAGYNGQIGGNFSNDLIVASLMLRSLPIGGTAVGTGINAHSKFAPRVCELLSEWTNTKPPFKESKNHFADQATLDSAVGAHAILKSLAVSLIKISNDIRWMGSGPRAGLGELELPAVQPGSSIMPGKVNPVICESVLMVCQRVIGNDAAMTAAASASNFELAMSIPLAALLLHESITLLANACKNLSAQCIDGLKATNRGPELVEKGLMLATALAPVLGYDQAANIAKEAAKTGKTIREVAREKTNLTDQQLQDLLNPAKMTEPGTHGGPTGG
ncbi:MAG: class II fumarate hydratase [Phycisphaerae bacterium]